MKGLSALVILIGMILSGCNSNIVFEAKHVFDSNSWAASEIVAFEFEVLDTLTYHNFYFKLYNSQYYPYNNLWLFIETEGPIASIRDTIECPLADATGKWFGDASGETINNRIMFKRNARFSVPGKYRISFEQAMREPQLAEVNSIGFELEQAN